jgi:hypothetical protein
VQGNSEIIKLLEQREGHMIKHSCITSGVCPRNVCRSGGTSFIKRSKDASASRVLTLNTSSSLSAQYVATLASVVTTMITVLDLESLDTKEDCIVSHSSVD